MQQSMHLVPPVSNEPVIKKTIRKTDWFDNGSENTERPAKAAPKCKKTCSLLQTSFVWGVCTDRRL